MPRTAFAVLNIAAQNGLYYYEWRTSTCYGNVNNFHKQQTSRVCIENEALFIRGYFDFSIFQFSAVAHPAPMWPVPTSAVLRAADCLLLSLWMVKHHTFEATISLSPQSETN